MATAGASAPILAPTATATPNATPLATITAVHLVLSATPTGLSIEPPTATAGPSATASPTATPGPSVTAGPTPTRTSALPPESGWTAYGGEWDWREPGVAEGTSTEGDALWLYEETYGDFEFSAEVLTFDREASLAFRMQDENNGFIFTLVPQGATEGTPGIYLAKRVDGTDNIVAATEADDIPFTEDWATLRVEATGDSLRLYLNGALVIGYESGEDPSFPYGRVGLRIYGDAEEPCSSMFRSIRLP